MDTLDSRVAALEGDVCAGEPRVAAADEDVLRGEADAEPAEDGRRLGDAGRLVDPASATRTRSLTLPGSKTLAPAR